MRLLSDIFSLLCVIACILCAKQSAESASRAEQERRSLVDLAKSAVLEARKAAHP